MSTAWKERSGHWFARVPKTDNIDDDALSAGKLIEVALAARDLVPIHGVRIEILLATNLADKDHWVFQTRDSYRPARIRIANALMPGDLVLVTEPGETITNNSLVGEVMRVVEPDYSPGYWNGTPGQPHLTEVESVYGVGREFLEHGTYEIWEEEE